MASKTTIFVISDTHGNTNLVNEFITEAKKHNPDLIYHLGDYYDDAQPILDAGFPVVRVPGTWTDYYQDFRIQNRRIEMIYNWRLYLTHTPTKHYNDRPEDSDPEEIIQTKQADIVLHGHTHIYGVEKHNDVLIVNPGHCKAEMDKGRPATYGVLEVDEQTINAKIISLISNEIKEDNVFDIK